jgi:hypothetical protein
MSLNSMKSESGIRVIEVTMERMEVFVGRQGVVTGQPSRTASETDLNVGRRNPPTHSWVKWDGDDDSTLVFLPNLELMAAAQPRPAPTPKPLGREALATINGIRLDHAESTTLRVAVSDFVMMLSDPERMAALGGIGPEYMRVAQVLENILIYGKRHV